MKEDSKGQKEAKARVAALETEKKKFLQSVEDYKKVLEEEWKQLAHEKENLMKEQKNYLEFKEKARALAAAADNMITFNVSGTRFQTTKATLLKIPDTFFALMIGSNMWHPNKDGEYFIDRNPKYFGYVLDYLRLGENPLSLAMPQYKRREIMAEFDFFQLPNNISPLIFGSCQSTSIPAGYRRITTADLKNPEFVEDMLAYYTANNGFLQLVTFKPGNAVHIDGGWLMVNSHYITNVGYSGVTLQKDSYYKWQDHSNKQDFSNLAFTTVASTTCSPNSSYPAFVVSTGDV